MNIATQADIELAGFMDRHNRVMLQFSAGKDSAACLKLLRQWIDKVLLVWACPGNAYPETLRYMERIAASVPHFQTVHGSQPEFAERYGYPVDLLPFESTPFGRMVSKHPGPPLTHVTECCGANLWNPLRVAVEDHPECTGIIKGEKDVDELAARPRVVHVGGREYHYPLLTWTDTDVYTFLDPEELPESYRRGHKSSFDCMRCTGYLGHSPGRLLELQALHPGEWAAIEPVVRYQRTRTARHLTELMVELPSS